MEVVPKNVVPPHQARMNELKSSIGVERIVEELLASVAYKQTIKLIKNFIEEFNRDLLIV